MNVPVFPGPGLPRRAGVGFKPDHFADIAGAAQPIGFFEIHAENYMGAGGPPHARLARLRADYALSVHGVGLSIGGEDPLDDDHLSRLAELCARYEPASFSEHLAWSSHGDVFLNDLLPLPYTPATLARVVEHVDRVQTALKRPMLLENPATYVVFSESTIAETDFLAEIAARTGCGLLLDLNNVHVSATNHGFSSADYLAAFPLAAVGEIHLAGHAVADGEGERLLIDAHDRAVCAEVWDLYDRLVERIGPVPTLIEWDNDVPDWATLRAEAVEADRRMAAAATRVAAREAA
ncbi:MNIO family bufferin maturase [Segnochrobactrum spirostomi]|uniref:UPF0276 protein F0357_00040 n=1 Tax=Segnochrobactrum spirostomi TaxID=2608987 RepID=A0A6A7XZU0_9HYPH|nr:DUF692 domain-containing protein [Segnochrobactrum spirostomi]MQT11092.1 DUF692 domain-containing protein [Segnochrobactrum spirostomi]